MVASDEDDGLAHDPVEKAIRESRDQRTAGIAVDDRVAFWQANDFLDPPVDCKKELLTEA